MNKEQLRMQMLAGIITESEYKAMLNEELSQDQIMQALKDLIEAGELTGAQVRVMMDDLKAYHRAWVNRQRSPENRSESAKYGAYMRTVEKRIFNLKPQIGHYTSIVDPQVNDLKTLKSFDTTKLAPEGASRVKKAIYYIENPQEWEKIEKERDERVKEMEKREKEGPQFSPLNEDLNINSEIIDFFKNNSFNTSDPYSLEYDIRDYIEDKIGRSLSPQEKGKITRVANKYRSEYFTKKFSDEREAEEKAAQKRYQNNLLPLTVDNGSGTPDSKYYELANTYTQTLKGGGTRITHSDPKSGYTDYKLKDEWIATPVDNSTLNQFWKDNVMNYYRIERK